MPTCHEQRLGKQYKPITYEEDAVVSDLTSLLIYIVWIVAIAIASIMIAWALYSGLHQRKDLVYWRKIKLGSAGFAIVGLFLFLMNFEKTVRDSIGAKNKEYNYAAFVDLKFYVLNQLITACARDKDGRQAELTCFDLRNVDKGLSWGDVRDGKPLHTVVNWQHNPDIDEFVSEVNRRLDDINAHNPVARAAESFLSVDSRIKVLMTALILMILSLAGSIGEAAYQLAQARTQVSAALKSTC